MRIKILEKLPVLTPVVAESDVLLRFPDVDKLSPPILQLTEVRTHLLTCLTTTDVITVIIKGYTPEIHMVCNLLFWQPS